MNGAFLAAAVAIALSQGQPALVRALTPPESVCKAAAKKTGAKLATILKERDEAAQAGAEYIMALAGVPYALTELGLDDTPKAVGQVEDDEELGDMAGALWQLGYSIYRAFGAPMARRMIITPQGVVAQITRATGADFDQAMRERNEWAEEQVEFFEALAGRRR